MTQPMHDLLSIPAGLVTFAKPPEPVGYWALYPGATPYTQFPVYKRPTDEQIRSTEALLGWGWLEADNAIKEQP